MDKKDEKEKIGVYVCHCGTNIAGIVDVEEVRDWAGSRLKDRGVVVSRDYKFMCSSLGQEMIEKDIKELGLTRVVAVPRQRRGQVRHWRGAGGRWGRVGGGVSHGN